MGLWINSDITLDRLIRTNIERPHGFRFVPNQDENCALRSKPQTAKIPGGKNVIMLTRKQYELLIYIDSYLKRTGYSPSFEEMKEALSLKSKSGIHRLISALEERGYLGRRHHRARALEVLRLPDNMTIRPDTIADFAEDDDE